MTDDNSVVDPREFVSIIVVVIVAIGGISALLTARYGILVWNNVFREGWTVVSTAVLAGIFTGWVSWRWRKSSLGRLLITLTHLGLMCLLAIMLVKRLATSDAWFGIWLVVFQTGVSNIVENLLSTSFFHPVAVVNVGEDSVE
ncbi:MAG: hypothetical protein SXV54_11195 [Chloroflexota bacterium]|nr:hypothetical protein [Chloroflexota bacterium]